MTAAADRSLRRRIFAMAMRLATVKSDAIDLAIEVGRGSHAAFACAQRIEDAFDLADDEVYKLLDLARSEAPS